MSERTREIAGGYGHASEECPECGCIRCTKDHSDLYPDDELPPWAEKEEKKVD